MLKISRRKIAPLTRDGDVEYRDAISLAQASQYTDAYIQIQNAIAKNPHRAHYFNLAGNILKCLKRFDEAANNYKKSIKIDSHCASAHHNLGVVFFHQQKYFSAQIQYEKALSIFPGYPDAIRNLRILGDRYTLENNFLCAEKIFEKLILYAPKESEFYHRLGIALYHQKQFKKAIPIFEKVLSMNSRHMEAHQYLANCLLETRSFDAALQHYYQQIEFQPFFESYYNIGVLNLMKDKFNDAVMYFEKALTLNENDFSCYVNLGNACLKKRDIAKAVLAYEKAHALNPGDAQARYILSALQAKNDETRAPKDYIKNLFDQYAPYYDRQLQSYLYYDVPNKISRAIELFLPEMLQSHALRIIDLGCGTGLSGEKLVPFARELIGIDLSARMLSAAKDKNIYHELIEADIVDALPQFSEIDLMVAMDVLSYFGDLSFLFSAVHRALKNNGHFIFTVEKGNAFFELQKTMRYQHSLDYLKNLCEQNQFMLMHTENIVLRKNHQENVEGLLMIIKMNGSASASDRAV